MVNSMATKVPRNTSAVRKGPASTSNTKPCRIPSCPGAQRPALEQPSSLCRQQLSCNRSPSSRGSGAVCQAGRHSGAAAVFSGGEIVEVKELKGIRVVAGEGGRPQVQYLVAWRDNSQDTWEPASNLADNLLRDYEQKWWGAVKKGDEETLNKMLASGGKVLARTLDDNRRSALHFAAALGKVDLVQNLVHNGAEVDLGDKDGYTPLHMAAGYLHTSTINALLQAGADPEQQDANGRSPMALVESLSAALPASNPALVGRRIALEEVVKVLTDNLFEDVEPAAVLDSRDNEEEGHREFLVRWQDGREEGWVAEKYMSQEVIEDFEGGLEYADAECVLGVKVRGDSRTYRVRWLDGYPDSWEPEEHVSPDLVALFEQQQALLSGNGQQQHSTLQHQAVAGNGNGAAAAQGQQLEQQGQQQHHHHQQQQQQSGSQRDGDSRVLQAAAQ